MNETDYGLLEDEQDELAQAVAYQDPSLMGSVPPVGGGARSIAPNAVSDAVMESVMARMAAEDEQLRAIRQRRDEDIGRANLYQGITQIAAGLAGQKADTTAFDNARALAVQQAREGETDADRRRKLVSDAIRQKYMESFRQERTQAEKDKASAIASAAEKRTQAAEKRNAEAQKARQERINTMNLRAASQIMNRPQINKERTRLSAASNAQALVDKIRGGQLKDSSNISKQLTNLIATIEMGGPGAVDDRRAMGVESLYTDANKMLSFVTGNPTSVIPAKYLDQLETEVKALSKNAVNNYKRFTDEAIAGTDLSQLDPGGEANPGTVNTLARSMQKKFFESVGVDEEGNFKPREGQDKVLVISPDGRKGMIPVKNLEKALQQGYTRG